jgi:hypothetical protein
MKRANIRAQHWNLNALHTLSIEMTLLDQIQLLLFYQTGQGQIKSAFFDLSDILILLCSNSSVGVESTSFFILLFLSLQLTKS